MKVAISGFGRIGRTVLRSAVERNLLGKGFELVAINDTHDLAQTAYLMKHDTAFGTLAAEVETGDKKLIINGYEISMVSNRDPAQLPWKQLGVELVLECTGAFTDKASASLHLQAGAKKVLISAPGKGVDATIVLGVNEKTYDPSKHQIVSLASCTTNCLAPVAKVLQDNFGIERGFMTTIHAYTGDQTILDDHHKKDWRRARTAAANIIPTSTGAAKAIGEVIPELKGKLDGLALRVPVITGSMNDLTCQVRRETTAEEVNAALKAAAEGPMKGILQYTDEELVSSDIIHSPYSSIFDSKLTKVMGTQVKTLSWYDNEYGYSCRMVDAAMKLFK